MAEADPDYTPRIEAQNITVYTLTVRSGCIIQDRATVYLTTKAHELKARLITRLNCNGFPYSDVQTVEDSDWDDLIFSFRNETAIIETHCVPLWLPDSGGSLLEVMFR